MEVTEISEYSHINKNEWQISRSPGSGGHESKVMFIDWNYQDFDL